MTEDRKVCLNVTSVVKAATGLTTVVCQMPLRNNGTCPVHGSKVKQVITMPGKSGSRKQCQKLLSSNVKHDTYALKKAKCKMYLLPDGTCPEHGRNISG